MLSNSDPHMGDEADDGTRSAPAETGRRVIGPLTRRGMLMTVAALAGVAAVPSLGETGSARADGISPDQQPSFQAIGPAPDSGIGVNATLGGEVTPTFVEGVRGNGSTYGVGGFGPNYGVRGSGGSVGVRGAGTANTTGVLGVSFTDATETVHGSGAGVQGDSGSGFGVAGYSETGFGVSGQSQHSVAISGQGATGVQGTCQPLSGMGVVGTTGTGVGVQGRAIDGIGVEGLTHSLLSPAIHGANTGKGGAIWGESGGTYGVLGTTSGNPGAYDAGGGVVGAHTTGYGVGVAGYSLADPSQAPKVHPPLATGVFGIGDSAGLEGHSADYGEAVRGLNLGNKTGVLGICFRDAGQKHHGSGIGVQGNSGSGPGVAGFSKSGAGVYGQSPAVGVSGQGAIGIEGISTKGVGTVGETKSGAGVKGQAGSGVGVVASNKSASHAALYAHNAGRGSGTYSVSSDGYGAELAGGKAPLRLIPHASVGPPGSGFHLTGELMVDTAGELHLCIKSGTPGTWKKVLLG